MVKTIFFEILREVEKFGEVDWPWVRINVDAINIDLFNGVGDELFDVLFDILFPPLVSDHEGEFDGVGDGCTIVDDFLSVYGYFRVHGWSEVGSVAERTSFHLNVVDEGVKLFLSEGIDLYVL